MVALLDLSVSPIVRTMGGRRAGPRSDPGGIAFNGGRAQMATRSAALCAYALPKVCVCVFGCGLAFAMPNPRRAASPHHVMPPLTPGRVVRVNRVCVVCLVFHLTSRSECCLRLLGWVVTPITSRSHGSLRSGCAQSRHRWTRRTCAPGPPRTGYTSRFVLVAHRQDGRKGRRPAVGLWWRRS